MAGYANNYGSGYTGGSGGNPPEYQDKPNADSLNGTYGTNTPAAKQNQQRQRATGGGSNGNGNGNGNQPADPYSAFHEASKGWWQNQPAAPAPATTSAPTSAPLTAPATVSAPVRAFSTQLANTLRGTSSSSNFSNPTPTPTPTTATVPAPAPDTPDTPVAPAFHDLPNGIVTLDGTATGPIAPPAVVPPLPVKPDHPLHPDFVQSALTSGDPAVEPPTTPTTPITPTTPPLDRTPAVPPTTPPTTSPATPPTDARTRPSTPPPVYSDANPPPHPKEGASLTEIGNYYRSFGYKNPAFRNITDQDIMQYWRDPKGMQFGDWYLAGNRAPKDSEPNPFGTTGMGDKPPGPAVPPTTPPTTTPSSNTSGTPYNGPNDYQIIADHNAEMEKIAHPPTTPPVPPPPPPLGGPPTDPNSPPASTPESDALSRTQHLYDPLFEQQRNDLARTLRAQGALDGSGNSGGFAESFGRSEARLSADQGAQLAGLTEAQRNRDQAMTIAVMNDATQRYGIKTNDDLQRWLNDPKNDTLQKYGIDKNLLMEKYKAELGLQGSQLIAGASFNAAALQAATQKAIAEANNATQLGLGTMNNNLGYGQLQGNLYNADQDRIIQEMKMLIDAGVTPAVAAQIAASFGPNAPVYKP